MHRLNRLSLAACLALLAVSASAEESALVGMQTADQARGWEAVGKLTLGQRGFCTGVLIAPGRVLTAAHCLYDKETGTRTPEDQISFQAGWRNGRAEAYRGIRRAIAHPDYVFGAEDDIGRVAYDLALLELDQPILLPQLPPFAVAESPADGASVSVVSYAMNRENVPSIEQGCAVLVSTEPALILTCDIDFGSSGAPVFVLQDGVARVVSVISAKAEMRGNKVSLGVPLDLPLARLEAEMEQVEPRQGPRAGVKLLKGGMSGGAKFVKP